MTETATSISLLSENSRAKIDAWRKKFPPNEARSASLYALRVVQEEQGWLSEDCMNAVAEYLQIPRIAVYEVATFYSMYDLKPTARHKVSVCTNISCLLCGCGKIVNHLKNRLGVDFNQATADGKFYLQEVECLAACAGAPALMIDDKHYHENLTPEKVDQILAAID